MTAGHWSTDDLGVAAYLHMNGARISRVEKLAQNSHVFFFSDPPRSLEEMKIAFFNSECCKFNMAILQMKKLCYGGKNRRPKWNA